MVGEAVTLDASLPFDAVSYGEFDRPWGLAVEPGTNRVFINQKGGAMKFVDTATGAIGTVSGGPDEVSSRGQGGLGEIVFAPDYAESGMIYISWSEAVSGRDKRSVAARGKLSCDSDTTCNIDGLTRIWQQSASFPRDGHFAHRMTFSPDGQYLFIASGDRQAKTPSQDTSNNLGAVVRLLPDGTPAPGNPFADQGAPTNQIWSYGHRNPLGFSFAPDGKLWVLEHGPAGGDELNLVEPGANYGWPVRSYGENYNGDPIPDHTPDDGFTKPLIHWTPVIAPGDMAAYSGAMFGDWEGDLLSANLRAKSLVRIETAADGSSANVAANYRFPERLRGITIAPDGAIWVAEDAEDGRLLRLTPR